MENSLKETKYEEIILSKQFNQREEKLFKKIKELNEVTKFKDFYDLLKIKEEILIAQKELKRHKKELERKLIQIYSFAKYFEVIIEDNKNFFLLIGNAKLSILSLGILPQKKHFPNLTDDFKFYGSDYISPIGFKMKRRYHKYEGCRRKTDTIFYVCQITEDGPIVKSEDKRKVWKGENILEDMNKSFCDENKISDIIDFFYLRSMQLRNKIQFLGNVKEFEGYKQIFL